eukprot:507390-Pleurochrysis_carterae.AAC.1
MAPTRCHISCLYVLPARDRMHAIDAIGRAHACVDRRVCKEPCSTQESACTCAPACRAALDHLLRGVHRPRPRRCSQGVDA